MAGLAPRNIVLSSAACKMRSCQGRLSDNEHRLYREISFEISLSGWCVGVQRRGNRHAARIIGRRLLSRPKMADERGAIKSVVGRIIVAA